MHHVALATALALASFSASLLGVHVLFPEAASGAVETVEQAPIAAGDGAEPWEAHVLCEA